MAAKHEFRPSFGPDFCPNFAPRWLTRLECPDGPDGLWQMTYAG
jgi:hypothetical protein